MKRFRILGLAAMLIGLLSAFSSVNSKSSRFYPQTSGWVPVETDCSFFGLESPVACDVTYTGPVCTANLGTPAYITQAACELEISAGLLKKPF